MMNALKASSRSSHTSVLKRVSLLILISLVLSGEAFAGAWVQEKGQGLGIVTARWYESGERWDDRRDIVDAPHYRKLELNPFIEYGVTEKLTAGASLFLLSIDSSNEDGGGLSDIEFFGRYLIRKGDFSATSVQFLVKTPGPYTTELAPGLGQDQYDLELRLLHGIGGAVWEGAWYINVEGALRKRFEAPSDELRLDLAAGWKTGDGRWEIEVKEENIIGLRNGEDPSAEYDLHKVSPSVRYWATGRVGVQAGFSADVYGRNTGKGKSALAALWMRF